MDLLHAVTVSLLPVSRLKAAAVFHELRQAHGEVPLDLLVDALRVPPGERSSMIATALDAAAAALREAASRGIEVVASFDERYPALLACTSDPPPVLWVRGNLDVLARPAVAVIGSRAASPYALQVGRRLAAELAERGMVVVSGLARGVDSSAHQGCLGAAGETVAVLGSGLEHVYPTEHVGLSRKISEKGLLVSELAPAVPPRAEHFPLRNRIISGISLATVVVEASEKSGSLITAACALRQGREVMAVPGSVLSGRNRGSHALLKDGAKVVEAADDILEELGWSAAAGSGGRSVPAQGKPIDPILGKMDPGEPYRLEDLVDLTGVAAVKLLPRLMEFELLGQLETAPGGRFVRQP
jgi:DNA processing protein